MLTRLLFLSFLFSSIMYAQWHTFEGLYTQQQAKKMCKARELRLPQIYELFTLKGNPNYPKDTSYWSINDLNTNFSLSAGGETESRLDQDAQPAYAFYLQDGDISITPKSKKIHLLCTDAPLTAQSKRSFTELDQGILDEDLDLVWQQKEKKNRDLKLSYQDAKQYCQELDQYGMRWRLPTLEELFSLVEYRFIKPTLNAKYFKHTMLRYHWTATPYKKNDAYVVGFKLGSIATSAQINHSYFRCVSEDTP